MGLDIRRASETIQAHASVGDMRHARNEILQPGREAHVSVDIESLVSPIAHEGSRIEGVRRKHRNRCDICDWGFLSLARRELSEWRGASRSPHSRDYPPEQDTHRHRRTAKNSSSESIPLHREGRRVSGRKSHDCWYRPTTARRDGLYPKVATDGVSCRIAQSIVMSRSIPPSSSRGERNGNRSPVSCIAVVAERRFRHTVFSKYSISRMMGRNEPFRNDGSTHH